MYATIEEIKRVSKNLDVVQCATPSEIRDWGEEACLAIDRFCSHSFSFEQQVTKRIRVEDPFVPLPNILSGQIKLRSISCAHIEPPRITIDQHGEECVEFGDFEVLLNTDCLIYRLANRQHEAPALEHPDTLEITGDWGWAPDQETLVINFANGLKAAYEAHRILVPHHTIPDIINIITMADATTIDEAYALLGELEAVINKHILDETVHSYPVPVVPPAAPVIPSGSLLGAAAVSGDPFCATCVTVETGASGLVGSGVTSLDAILISLGVPPTTVEEANALIESLINLYNAHLWDTDLHNGEMDMDNAIRLSISNPILPAAIKRIFLKLVKRIAIRSCLDDELQYNSYYVSETTGDGYSYNMGNGSIRNLLRPEDREALWPYINHGRVVI